MNFLGISISIQQLNTDWLSRCAGFLCVEFSKIIYLVIHKKYSFRSDRCLLYKSGKSQTSINNLTIVIKHSICWSDLHNVFVVFKYACTKRSRQNFYIYHIKFVSHSRNNFLYSYLNW